MGGTYGDQFAGVPALCQLGIERSPVNLALVEFDIFVGQGDNLVIGHATSFVELSVSHYSLIGDITSSFCFRYCRLASPAFAYSISSLLTTSARAYPESKPKDHDGDNKQHQNFNQINALSSAQPDGNICSP